MKCMGRNFKTNIICYSLIISIITGLFAYFIPGTTYAYTEKKGVVQVDDALNVRKGPGTAYGKLTYGGANVKLSNGNELTIIGEQYAGDGAKWYQIRFQYKGVSLEGYVHSSYVYVEETIDYEKDGDFEKYMTDQGFPESYKNALRQLHAKYPSWVFVADRLNYDWNDVVKNESITGRSLISKSSISSWKSTEADAYNWETGIWYGFDGGSWAAASKELVAYALDPRNFLDEKYIFQFELLSYQPSIQTKDGLSKLLSGTFMENATVQNQSGVKISYADALMDAAALSGVSPYCLASAILQEQGKNGNGRSISGTVSGYEGYYNYFNWNAYASGGNSAVINGLIYAKKTDETSLRPWNSRYKSILGGAKLYGKSYINIGQDTIYYKKFDFVGTPYTHQYMTHIIAARNEGLTASQGYTDEMKKNTALVFKIPVFQNMPAQVCSLPTGDGSPNNTLRNLTVSVGSLTPTFDKFTQNYDITVDNSVSSITVQASAWDAGATVKNAGTYALNVGNNEIAIAVTAPNGETRTYRLYVNRKAAAQNTKPQEVKTSYQVKNLTLDENAMRISGITDGFTAEQMKNCINVTNGTFAIQDKNGAGKTGVLGTGDKVLIYDSQNKCLKTFEVLIYGDVNGDGDINVKDAFLLRKHILGEQKLTGVYAMSADVSKGDGITVKDAFIMKKHILGEGKITQ